MPKVTSFFFTYSFVSLVLVASVISVATVAAAAEAVCVVVSQSSTKSANVAGTCVCVVDGKMFLFCFFLSHLLAVYLPEHRHKHHISIFFFINTCSMQC